ncbi:MAG: nucleoside phosphorylase [Anaerolineae bacterium]|nr:nucleoside phosphorylase [Anaerolineae bacterium]
MSDYTYPILEFDASRDAILNPCPKALLRPLPQRGVLCFFADVISDLALSGALQQIGSLVSEIGLNPVYLMQREGKELFVCHPGVGAPLAAGFLEELIALGGRQFVACGSCGALKEGIGVGQLLILTAAVRDEGTSYHYLPAGHEVSASPSVVAALEKTFQRCGLPYRLTKTWTTDALYRETIERRAKRVSEGCEVVEMEAAAFFAVAEFRNVAFGQVVYGGDLVIPEGWDSRRWNARGNVRHLLFSLTVEACSALE